jgi:phage head maturation protease
VDGVVVRNRLVLRHVALTSSPAYHGAEVLAVRSVERDANPRRALAALDYVERMRAR